MVASIVRERRTYVRKDGIATLARRPMTATTIISSTRENPLLKADA
jgi:hypothetical protein